MVGNNICLQRDCFFLFFFLAISCQLANLVLSFSLSLVLKEKHNTQWMMLMEYSSQKNTSKASKVCNAIHYLSGKQNEASLTTNLSLTTTKTTTTTTITSTTTKTTTIFLWKKKVKLRIKVTWLDYPRKYTTRLRETSANCFVVSPLCCWIDRSFDDEK